MVRTRPASAPAWNPPLVQSKSRQGHPALAQLGLHGVVQENPIERQTHSSCRRPSPPPPARLVLGRSGQASPTSCSHTGHPRRSPAWTRGILKSPWRSCTVIRWRSRRIAVVAKCPPVKVDRNCHNGIGWHVLTEPCRCVVHVQRIKDGCLGKLGKRHWRRQRRRIRKVGKGHSSANAAT